MSMHAKFGYLDLVKSLIKEFQFSPVDILSNEKKASQKDWKFESSFRLDCN